MRKQKQKGTRKRRASSADLRFAFVLAGVAGIVVVLGSALVSQIRAAAWPSAAISGAIIVALVLAAAYSAIQRRRT